MQDNTSTTAFLEALNPSHGTILVYTKPILTTGTKQPPNRPVCFSDPAALIAEASRLNQEKRNVYFTPARYNALPRNKANVVSCRAVWIDMDIRAGKGYDDMRDALDGLKNLCKKYSLPVPTVVITGGGIHVYWITDFDIPPKLWESYAGTLHAMVKASGDSKMCDDTARITDISSMMRLPGTVNHTRAADAFVLKTAPIIPYADFAAMFSVAARPTSSAAMKPAVPVTSAFSFGAKPAHLQKAVVQATATPVVAAQAFSFGDRPAHLSKPVERTVAPPTGMTKNQPTMDAVKPTYAQLLSKCALIRHFAQHPADVSEPEWKYSLNVILRTEGGEAACHEFSCGHPGYAADETDAKIAAAREFGKPVTCATLAGVSPVGHMCSGCSNEGRDVSPLKGTHTVGIIQLGGSALEQVAATVEANRIAKEVPVTTDADGDVFWNVIPLHPGSNMQAPHIKLPPPPPGYVYGNMTTGKAGVFSVENVMTPITEDLVWVDRRTITLSETGPRVHGYRVNHIGADGVHQKVYISGKDLGQRAMEPWLLESGIATDVPQEMAAYLKASCDAVRRDGKQPLYIVSGYGWYNVDGKRVFVAPSEVITEDGKSVGLLVGADNRKVTEVAKAEGSTEAWLEAYRAMFGPDDHHIHLYAAASLASVLYHPLQDKSSSAANGIIMVLSGLSGSGKTLATQVCQSLWEPVKQIAGNSTLNALVKEAVARRHTPLFVDDLVINPNKEARVEARNAFLTYTTGQEKARVSNSIQLDKGGSWANIMFISTNTDVTTTIDGIDQGGGATARIIEVRMTAPKSTDRIDLRWATQAIHANTGLFGPMFVRRLMQESPQQLQARVTKYEGTLSDSLRKAGVDPGLVNALRIRIQLIAMCAVTADIFSDMMPYPMQPTIQWALESLAKGEFMLAAHDAVGEDTKLRLLRRLTSLIEAGSNTAFEMIMDSTDPDYKPTLKDLKEKFFDDTGHEIMPEQWVWNQNAQLIGRKGTTADLVHAMTQDGTHAGWYLRTDYLNDPRTGVDSVRTIVDVLGAPQELTGPTGDKRVVTLSMQKFMNGRSRGVSARYVFITPHEQQLAATGYNQEDYE